jgi:EAL domain-containing protein (putative c-di-GMP-specific phosphodiesterase class I)
MYIGKGLIDTATVPEAQTSARGRLALLADLRRAVDQQEFELYYQPIYQLDGRRMVGAEALIRWRDARRGLVDPASFVALAEETGLIIPLGEWILRRACTDAAGWPAQLSVAVNLSPVQIRHGNLVEFVKGVLAETGLAPERLELEVTESAILHSSKENLETLHQLQLMGVSVVLDDFGTGYSSLTHLRLFPFGKIKIDRSFVRELENNAESAAIVSAMASLGHGLSIGTVAEGVETEDQLVLVRSAGCTHAQGYLFGLPCPAGDLEFRRTRHGKEKIAAA